MLKRSLILSAILLPLSSVASDKEVQDMSDPLAMIQPLV